MKVAEYVVVFVAVVVTLDVVVIDFVFVVKDVFIFFIDVVADVGIVSVVVGLLSRHFLMWSYALSRLQLISTSLLWKLF